MGLKTKNRLTVFLLLLLAVGIYLYALPVEVSGLLLKTVKNVF